jgi:hypothetical protein
MTEVAYGEKNVWRIPVALNLPLGTHLEAFSWYNLVVNESPTTPLQVAGWRCRIWEVILIIVPDQGTHLDFSSQPLHPSMQFV